MLADRLRLGDETAPRPGTDELDRNGRQADNATCGAA